jgi:AhpD family alkylhydroperoxidase
MGIEKIALKNPDVAKAFSELRKVVFSEGKLSVKQKELIAVGISVAIRCSPCIKSHVSKALEAGATREEILEAASVALIMRGGPAVSYIEELIEQIES